MNEARLLSRFPKVFARGASIIAIEAIIAVERANS
jgi:hypothetical protein